MDNWKQWARNRTEDARRALSSGASAPAGGTSGPGGGAGGEGGGRRSSLDASDSASSPTPFTGSSADEFDLEKNQLRLPPSSSSSSKRRRRRRRKSKGRITERDIENRNDDPDSEGEEQDKPWSTAAKQYGILVGEAEEEEVEALEWDEFFRSRAEEGTSGTGKFRSLMNWEVTRKRLRYYLPILSWLPKYDVRNDLVWDVGAGLAITAVIIPHSMAMAILAGLPPVYGLYTVWISALIYALLGNSRQLSIGPETVTSILLGLTWTNHNDLEEEDYPVIAHTIAFLGGFLLFFLGLFRFGFLDSLLSRPLLSGFINAIAVIIFMEQSDIILGVGNPKEHGWHKISHIYHHLEHVHWQTFVIGLFGILYLLSIKIMNTKIKASQTTNRYLKALRFFPDTLVLVGTGIVVAWAFNWDEKGVTILGTINSGFPPPTWPLKSIGLIQDYSQSSVIIAVLGFIESVITAKYYANKNKYFVSPNRELVALGTANIIGSFFQIFPAYGSLMRSAIVDMAGARTQLYQLIVSALVLFTVLFLGPLFYYLPKVILASIVLVAALGLVELEDLIFLCRIKAWGAVGLLLGTFLATIILGVELGIVISLGISVLYIIKKTSLPNIAILGRIPGTNKYKDISEFDDAKPIPGVLMVRIEESLYFANIGKITDMFSRFERFGDMTALPVSSENGEESKRPPLQAIIIDARDVHEMDASAIQVVAEMAHDYRERSIILCFVKLRKKLQELFLLSGITDTLGGKEMFFTSTRAAVAWLQRPVNNTTESVVVMPKEKDSPLGVGDSSPASSSDVIGSGLPTSGGSNGNLVEISPAEGEHVLGPFSDDI
ncbi:Sulfate transporter [Balamuthia mandrillaris]